MFEDGCESCKFCQIVRGEVRSHIVFEDGVTFAFLDHRPLFAGHCLLIPKEHYETLSDLPAAVVPALFSNVQLVARSVEEGLAADGSFVAINNRVSQSVPHLHVHVVPRRKKDGLKGFFWPRQKYENEEAILKVQETLRSTIARIKGAPPDQI
ncbi:MAG: HIT family protein [Acidobacteria bacterium]|nr:MAG: HIT family protein [Acidobacteriota bacterium]